MKLKDRKPTHYALGLDLGELNGMPMISHTGEVSGFLTSNAVFPAKGVAVVVCSNEDGISLIGPLARQIAELLLGGAPAKDTCAGSRDSGRAARGPHGSRDLHFGRKFLFQRRGAAGLSRRRWMGWESCKTSPKPTSNCEAA